MGQDFLGHAVINRKLNYLRKYENIYKKAKENYKQAQWRFASSQKKTTKKIFFLYIFSFF